MLLTRCPSCRTAFRVTDEALATANGRVRCGRCKTVFDAHAELGQASSAAGGAPAAEGGEDRPAAGTAVPVQAAAAAARADESASLQTTAGTAVEETDTAAAQPAGAGETRTAEATAAATAMATSEDDTFGDLSLLDVLEHVASGGDEDEDDEPLDASTRDQREAPDGDEDDGRTDEARTDAYISPEQIEAVLEDEDRAWPMTAPMWELEQPAERPPASLWWRYGVMLTALLLAAQVIHHWRADLAVHDTFGPWLQRAYGWFGVSVVPSWDLEQYRIMDWIATAEPGAEGGGSLDITARIQNRGPRAQPYPHVHLQLKDRWERPVGSRVFRPEEYALDGVRLPSFMAAGDTARAHLEIVDPGSGAYGFELDVCLEVQGGALACANDTLFR